MALALGGKTMAISTIFGCSGTVFYCLMSDEKVIYLPFALVSVALISTALGGIRCGMSADVKGWFHGCMAAACYLVAVIIIKEMVFPATHFNQSELVMAGIILTVGGAGGILGINMKYLLRRKTRQFSNSQI